MSLGNILGGAMQGIGAGLVKVGEEQAKQDQADVLARRQAALAKFTQDREDGRQATKVAADAKAAEVGHGYKLDEQKNAGEIANQNDKDHVERETASKIGIEAVKARNEAALESLKSHYRLNEVQAKAAADLVNQTTMAGIEVGATKIAADGTMYIYNKAGKAIGHSEVGQFAIPKSADNDGGILGGRGNALSTQKSSTNPTQNKKPIDGWAGVSITPVKGK
jgi:hypothetical protein